MSWKYLWEYGVQSSDILLSDDFLSSHHIAAQLTVNWYYCEKLENWSLLRVQILSLIQSFKPTKWSSLNSLLNHQSFFCFHFPQRSDPKWIEKKSIKMGEKKKEEKMGMSTITQQSNHQRKERKTSQNQSLRLKSLPLRRKRFVSLLITILYCCKINHYY